MTAGIAGKLFTFAIDIQDEGVDTVLGRAQDEAGLDGVALAAVYHDARDVFPHNPRRVVYYHDPGGVTFHPTAARYADLAIKPIVSDVARDEDVLQSVVDAAAQRGLRVDGWLNLLHCDRGREIVEHTTRNAFGDPSLTELCPANPHAAEYVAALCADVADRGVERIVAEGLHYYGFDHGYHHERAFVNVDARTKFLLGLCFCQYCARMARDDGIDVDELASWVRGAVRSSLDGSVPADNDPLTRATMAEECDGALGRLIDIRLRCVTQLVRTCGEAVHGSQGGVRLAVMDPGGAIKGYLSGRPQGAFAADTGWTIGLDIAEVARHCDEIQTMSYAADPARIRAEYARYIEVAGPEATIATVLRPAVPDCSSAADLATKVMELRDCGATQIDYYHYGLMRLDALGWIAHAQQELRVP